jgi:hypothetical protein
MSLAAVTSRLSHGFTSARPGMGGMAAPVPVAMTTARRAERRRTDPSRAATSTTRSPARRPAPRTRSMPRSSSQGSWPESYQLLVIWSRRSRAAATSMGPVTASAAPGTRLTAAITSPGRRRALDGMQPQ